MARHVGRSKGCKICIQRKVKCDETLPECSQCRRHQRKCPGPTIGAVFIDMDWKKRRAVTTEESVPAALQLSASSKLKNSITARPRENRSTQTVTYYSREVNAYKLPSQSPSLASVNLVQIVSTYVHNGPHRTMGFSVPKGSSVNWVRYLPDLSNREPILDSALAAVCLAHIGKTQKDEHVLRMARLSYGFALKHFQAALILGRRDANILSAINCLSVYELYDSTLSNAIGYIKHIQGGQLVALDLNLSDQSPLSDTNCFHIFRTMMLYNSFASRKACRLAHYRRPSSQKFGKGFSELEDLEDTTVHIPGLAEQSDILLRSPYTTESMHLFSNIFSRWRNLTYQLNNWYFRLYQRHEVPFDYDKVEPGPQDPYPRINFGSRFTFTSYWIAESLMHYWASRVLLYDVLAQAITWSIQQGLMHAPNSLTLGPLPMLTSPSEQIYQDASIELAFPHDISLCAALVQQCQDKAARTTLKGVQYISVEKLGILASLRTFIPLYIAIQHFEKRQLMEELNLCWALARKLNKSELAIWKLLDLNSNGWRGIIESDSGYMNCS